MSAQKYFPSIEKSCFAPIDLQKKYCRPQTILGMRLNGNQETHEVAEKTASIAPEFNTVGMDVVWVFYDDEYRAMSSKQILSSFHLVQPAPQDALVGKTQDDAFLSPKGALKSYLFQKQKTDIFMSGVNLSACVLATAVGALINGYNVHLITDLTADGNGYQASTAKEKQLEAFDDTLRASLSKLNKDRLGMLTYTNSNAVLSHYKITARKLAFA